MAGSKRERELHRQKLARQQADAAAASARRRKRLQIGGVVAGVAVVVAAVAGIALANGSDSSDGTSAEAVPSIAPTSTAGVTCAPVNKKKPLTKTYKKSDAQLINGADYVANMDTNCGRIVFTMDVKKAPLATKAVAFLSDSQFYDNTLCHRLTTGGGNYVIQCGDPKGNGSGGPGFQYGEENLPTSDGTAASVVYPRGTVAMANGGTGTTGSQFFIVYRDSTFPPNYTRLGYVKSGMNVVDYVASKGTVDGGPDGRPKQPLQITKMQSSATVTQAAPTPVRTTTSPK